MIATMAAAVVGDRQTAPTKSALVSSYAIALPFRWAVVPLPGTKRLGNPEPQASEQGRLPDRQGREKHGGQRTPVDR
jgi:hypothetical protein